MPDRPRKPRPPALPQQRPVAATRSIRPLAMLGTLGLLCASIATLASCGAGDRAGAAPIVRDSAGITIVENVAPLWTDENAWRVEAGPTLDIGVLEGDPAYQFFRIRGVARLSDGRIVVANGGSGELRYYDPTGRHLLSTGGQGGGPGEFASLGRILRLPGDSVLAVDLSRPRVAVFDGAGRYVQSFDVRTPVGRLDDGTFVRLASVPLDAMPQTGPLRQPQRILLVAADGETADTVALVPGTESYLVVDQSESAVSILRRSAPFHRTQSVIVAGDRLYSSAGDDYEITVHAPDGTVSGLIRRLVPNRLVTDVDIDAFRDHERARATDDNARRSIERFLADAPYPETMPALDALIMDAEGMLWVRDYATPTEREERPQSWSVFDGDGRWLGTVETPVGLEVREIGSDYILGVWKDGFEVEHVRMHRIAKPKA